MIEVDNLTKLYGRTKAVDNVTFEVPRGQIVGFLGPNGAGKSTCMKVLTSFISPTHGTARVGGHDVVDESLKTRELIGYLPEDTPLYKDMGVVPYLSYVGSLRQIPGAEVDRRLREALETCGLRQMADRQISTLSKGFRQRVGLAQALLHTPDLLILDEPTEGLDPNQVVEIRKLIREIGKDRTVMLSTHRLPEVQAVCDRVIIIHEGRLVFDRQLSELRSDRFRVEVVADGTGSGEVQAALEGVKGVESVEEADADGEGVQGWSVNAAEDTDVRRELFAAAVDRGWTLQELRRDQESLEEVFRRATMGQA